ncbi:phosphomannomutase [Pseudothioclava nitratireducens]|uniref:phosphomannomutase n=1 Tax=Pseudothioclava nitratireducens TaxID=1928646 RepID=UPI0023DB366A|nr:phosphomannomutase [Defluviimonas nitratireducens]MDF1621698.1 phosphomannomutase [Defluviimonas nitratireducens]
MSDLNCFKAYDIRGRLGIDLDDNIAYRIGAAFAVALNAKTVVLGRDVRASSEALSKSVAQGLIDQGCDVLDLGLSGTEEMYFATTHFGSDGGICVTASHNPMDYNGMKMVRAGSAPLDAASGLARIKELAEENAFATNATMGTIRNVAAEARSAYVERICEFVDIAALKPLKILVNAGHGAAGPTFDAIAARLADLGSPLTFERLFHEPDGSFPQGIPNPLLPENRPATAEAVRATGADFGVAWDGDFDRCFFFDHTGAFIDGEYVVGLLAEAFLAKDPGATIIHDPRIIWNTQDLVSKAGGRAVQTRTGHAFIKQAMRDENAVYGGEMSAHHYFRDFVYCDSGMIPWLLVAELVSRHGPLADLVADRKAAFPSSGEINFTLDDPKAAIARVRTEFELEAISIDEMDGLGFDMSDWRFNLRSSNTEPVVRLNVEARGDAELVVKGVERVKRILLG